MIEMLLLPEQKTAVFIQAGRDEEKQEVEKQKRPAYGHRKAPRARWQG
jgi:hypothetical protein